MATIAIVDDTVDDREFMKLFLADEHKTFMFTNGVDFLEQHRVGVFDLVVLDLVMPDVDGYQVIAKMRQRGDNIPVIALSARAYLADREHALKAGCADFVAKPIVDFEQFRRTINRLLRSNPQAS